MSETKTPSGATLHEIARVLVNQYDRSWAGGPRSWPHREDELLLVLAVRGAGLSAEATENLLTTRLPVAFALGGRENAIKTVENSLEARQPRSTGETCPNCGADSWGPQSLMHNNCAACGAQVGAFGAYSLPDGQGIRRKEQG